jgi:hypothetical protein
MAHAQLSPSSAERWMTCPGSVALSKGAPDDSSKFADHGTDAHELAALCLETDTDAAAYAGRIMAKGNSVDGEMVSAVQDYVDYVRGVVAATSGTLMVEQRLPISGITGEADAHGTSDTVILAGDELSVVDLKYGRGVPVSAEDNPQLQIYALAAYNEFSLAQDFKTVRMVIHQPRLNAVSEWVQTVEELQAFGEAVAEAAAATHLPNAPLVPSDKGCKFCRVKATCPALRELAMADFESLIPATADADALSEVMSKADLMETFIKAVRAEVERRLFAGQPVPGYKIVQGKRGNRAWTNKNEAEALLKSMRLKVEDMYELSLISPTSADKLAKAGAIGPKQWNRVMALIAQSEGKPSVAPESDKRPALVLSASADDFSDVSLPPTDLS